MRQWTTLGTNLWKVKVFNLNYVEHKFNGRTHKLALTVAALYEIYEKFEYSTDIIGLLKIDQNSSESWKNTCWLYALLAAQGELQRRALGYSPEPMLTMDEVLRFAAPADLPGIKMAIYEAVNMGFACAVERSEDEEVDLVLKELELQEKKKEAGAGNELLSSFLAAVCSSFAEKTPHS